MAEQATSGAMDVLLTVVRGNCQDAIDVKKKDSAEFAKFRWEKRTAQAKQDRRQAAQWLHGQMYGLGEAPDVAVTRHATDNPFSNKRLSNAITATQLAYQSSNEPFL